MEQFPATAQLIDIVGQFVTAVIVGWVCLIPVLEDYGVIRSRDRDTN